MLFHCELSLCGKRLHGFSICVSMKNVCKQQIGMCVCMRQPGEAPPGVTAGLSQCGDPADE